MARTTARLRTSAVIWAMGSPGSVEPKMKMARRAISAATTRRQPQPVIGLDGS
jgi:hypothetical protein